MPRTRFIALALLALAGCAARAATDPPVAVRGPGAEVILGGPGVPVGTPAGALLGIPEGQRPPPGSCRVWYPGLPPGQQPPPGPCRVRVPEGAVLVRG